MVQYGRSGRFLDEICTVTPAGQLCEKQFEKVLWNMVGKQLQIWSSFSLPGKRCPCTWTISKWQEKNLDPMWKIFMKDVDFGERTSFLDHVYFCLHSTRMQNKQRYCGQSEGLVRIQDLCWCCGKTSCFQEIGCEYFFMVPSHGRSCKEMRGTTLWTREQKNSTTVQSYNSMSWKKKNWDLLENCQKFAHRLFWNVCIWLELVDLTFFMVSKQVPPCHHEMERERATDAWHLWSLTFITHVNSNKIVMWNNRQQCRLGIFQYSDFAGRPRKFKINIRENLMFLWKSHVRANKLDVQFYRSWNKKGAWKGGVRPFDFQVFFFLD